MEYNGNEMLQGTGHPAEIQEFYSRFSAGCLNLFLVAKSVRLVMYAFGTKVDNISE